MRIALHASVNRIVVSSSKSPRAETRLAAFPHFRHRRFASGKKLNDNTQAWISLESNLHDFSAWIRSRTRLGLAKDAPEGRSIRRRELGRAVLEVGSLHHRDDRRASRAPYPQAANELWHDASTGCFKGGPSEARIFGWRGNMRRRTWNMG